MQAQLQMKLDFLSEKKEWVFTKNPTACLM